MKKSILVLSMFSLSVLVSGCSINGNDEFTCPNPEKGICMPAEQAYKYAEMGKDVNSLKAKFSKKDKLKKGQSDKEISSDGSKYSDVAPVVGVMTNPIQQPKPILEPAKVLKIWINSWEDESNVLHMPQTAYVEITPRRWNLKDANLHKFKSTSAFKKVH